MLQERHSNQTGAKPLNTKIFFQLARKMARKDGAEKDINRNKKKKSRKEAKNPKS